MRTVVTTALFSGAVSIFATVGLAQGWTDWEQENAVARHRDFLVIKQPDRGFCYVKQSYANDAEKMELMYQGDAPHISTPFLSGIEGSVRYWVDNGTKRTVHSDDFSSTQSFHLSKSVVPEMKAGHALFIKVDPSKRPVRTQRLSLMGFTAASKEISTATCQDAGDRSTPHLQVQVSRTADGGVAVGGETVLPDETQLIVSLRAEGFDYFAQNKVEVEAGSYRTEPFFHGDERLPEGPYRVSVTSSLMSLQPEPVERTLGSSGEKIPKDIRKASYGDAFVVDHSVSRNID